jgi:hypothetical protein
MYIYTIWIQDVFLWMIIVMIKLRIVGNIRSLLQYVNLLMHMHLVCIYYFILLHTKYYYFCYCCCCYCCCCCLYYFYYYCCFCDDSLFLKIGLYFYIHIYMFISIYSSTLLIILNFFLFSLPFLSLFLPPLSLLFCCIVFIKDVFTRVTTNVFRK